MGDGGGGDDAGGLRAAEGGEEQGGQEEVAEVVGAKLHLDALRGEGEGAGHDARAVHEDVKRAGGLEEAVGEVFDGAQVGKIEEFEVDVGGGAELRFDGSHGFLSLIRAPARQDDLRSVTSKFQGGKVADPTDCRPCAGLVLTIRAGAYVHSSTAVGSCHPYFVQKNCIRLCHAINLSFK